MQKRAGESEREREREQVVRIRMLITHFRRLRNLWFGVMEEGQLIRLYQQWARQIAIIKDLGSFVTLGSDEAGCLPSPVCLAQTIRTIASKPQSV